LLYLCKAAAFDISAVCCGFIYVLATAAQFLKSGAAERVLVVGADTFSRVIIRINRIIAQAKS